MITVCADSLSMSIQFEEQTEWGHFKLSEKLDANDFPSRTVSPHMNTICHFVYTDLMITFY